MKKSVIGSAFVLGVAAVATSLGGCSGKGSGADGTANVPSTPDTQRFGTVGMALTLPGGETITSVSWSINQGATVVMSGTQAIAPTATTISFLIPNVPSGTGYTITLTANSPDGLVHCVGTSATFNVAAQQTVPVNVLLACTNVGQADAGAVQVNGTPFQCATWTSASVSASTASVGQSLALTSSAVAPNPAGITYLWTASAGTIDTPSQALANFTCPSAPATVTITLTVGDGPVPTGATCPPATSSTILTVACGAVPCVGVGTGVEATPDTATGSCPAGSVNTGTLKDTNGNFCCSPPPCSGVGTGVEATPDTAAGTCPAGSTNSAKDAAGNFCCVALAPCTTAGQTGCVQCTGSAGNICTPTEAALVQHDINKGLAKAAGADPAGSCYACLVGGLGVDTGPVTGVECGDLASATDKANCLTTLNCILGSSCDSSGTISACYCGTAAPTGACLTGGANGVCDAQEAAGLGFPVTDGSDVLKNMTSTTLASGIANNIFVSASSNGCSACLQ